MSDEFDVDSRTFQDGIDPMWTALNKNDYTNNALHFYGDDHAFTKDGHLNIRTSATKTEVVGFNDLTLKKQHDVKYFKSAMLQSWNKFCFTGGLIEAEVVLPGRSDVGGLWPAFWLLGNLARHTYVGSSNNIWPWSQTACDPKHIDAQKVRGEASRGAVMVAVRFANTLLLYSFTPLFILSSARTSCPPALKRLTME